MREFWVSLGQGLIKLMVSLFVGFGTGMIVVGVYAAEQAEFWNMRTPPPGLFIGIGAGLLTAALMLCLLFFIPWSRGSSRKFGDETKPIE